MRHGARSPRAGSGSRLSSRTNDAAARKSKDAAARLGQARGGGRRGRRRRNRPGDDFAMLSGDGDQPTPADDTGTTVDGSTAGVARSTTTDRSSQPAARDPQRQVRVRVLDAALRPAGTRSGRQRQRARLTVRIRAANGGERRVALARPALLVGEARVQTDPSADGPGTRLGSLEAGETAVVSLRFEVAGTVTTQLTTQRRAQILVAGRTLPVSIKVGNAVDPSAASASPAP